MCNQFKKGGASLLQIVKEWIKNDDTCEWHDAESPWVSFDLDEERISEIHPATPTAIELDTLLTAIIYRVTSNGHRIQILSNREFTCAHLPATFSALLFEGEKQIASGRWATHPGAAALDLWVTYLWFYHQDRVCAAIANNQQGKNDDIN